MRLQHYSSGKGLNSLKDIFFLGVAMEVKNGRGTRFWSAKWCSRVPSEKLFPQIFALAQDPSLGISVCTLGGWWLEH